MTFYAHLVFGVFFVAKNALDASAVLSSGIAQKKPRNNFSAWL